MEMTLRKQIYASSLGVVLSLVGASIGAIAFVGWMLGSERLLNLIPGQPLMMPNTAISLVVIGAAAALRAQHAAGNVRLIFAVIAALFVLMIGIATIAEYAWPIQTGFDELIIRTQAGPYPGRMSPPTAVALTFLSLAILTFDFRLQKRVRPSEWFIVGAAVIASTALLGQLLGAGPLYRFTAMPIIGVAVQTAVGILLISSGMLLERPNSGVMTLIASKGPGGVLLRQLAPAAVVAPAIFAVVSIHLMTVEDQTQIELLFAALTVMSILASLILLTITAVSLNRAHETIERMQTQTRDLIDLASDGIYVADVSGRYIDVNPAGCRMLGYTREEILGMTVMDLIPPEDLPRLEDQREMLLAGAEKTNDWNLVCKDGRLLPTEVSTKILPDGRWQAFVRDVSDRKRAEREQQFLVSLGTALPATLDTDEVVSKILDLCVRDLADFGIIDLLFDGMLRRARVACRDVGSTTTCDILSRVCPDYDSCSTATLSRKRPILVETLTSEIVMSWGLAAEQDNALEDSGFRSAIEIPLVARGKAIGRLLLITTLAQRFYPQDLSFAESIGTLAALSVDNARLYRDARQATRARDEVLGIVAHDLRNPLQIISTDATVLRSGAGLNAEIGEEIQTATRRMNRLIQDLLDITQIDAGQLSIRLERFPVRELIDDVIQSQNVLVSASDIEIQSIVSFDLPDLLADRDRVLQVFENLIGNALKFTKPGGKITLAAEARPGEVVLSVADTGPGIAESDCSHIFDRFWQTSKSRGRGAGLGLGIVKGIVEAHGGRVWVTSAPGKGSTFHFTMPTLPKDVRQKMESSRSRETKIGSTL